MPIYDYIYGTMDKSADKLHEDSLKKQEELPDVVHLTHMTTPDSIYQLRIGFASFASEPHTSKWYIWLMWPMTRWFMIMTCLCGRTFTTERNAFKKLNLQSWAIPRYSIHGGELNGNGELYIKRYPELRVKVVDGSSLAVAIVINKIPKGTTQVLLLAKQQSKVASSIASALCQCGIQVVTLFKEEYEKLKPTTKSENHLLLSKSYTQKNWLPRGMMSAWRVAGIVHGLEGWNENESPTVLSDLLMVCFEHFFLVKKIGLFENMDKHG
ncbi:hypothetical protein LguiB_021571 [Lonicera macranthoides]